MGRARLKTEHRSRSGISRVTWVIKAKPEPKGGGRVGGDLGFRGCLTMSSSMPTDSVVL